MRFFTMKKLLWQSLGHKPATLKYPMQPVEPKERTRGHVEIDFDACIHCGLCQRRCPTGAIQVSRPDKSWSIERLNCIQCSSCVDNCPKKCLQMANGLPKPATEFGKEVHQVARVSSDSENPADSGGTGAK